MATPTVNTLLSVYGHLDGQHQPIEDIPSSSSSLASPEFQFQPQQQQESESNKKRKSPSLNNKKESLKKSKKSSDNDNKPAAAAAKGKKKKQTEDDDSIDSDDEATTERSRFRWTDELHQYFLSCIFELGLEIASPKKVFNKMMSDPAFAKLVVDEDMLEKMLNKDSINKFGAHHVKSHLQRFRQNVNNPKLAFVQQLAVLMQEAKDRKNDNKKTDKASKVLNPEYHVYPFIADREFPDGFAEKQRREYDEFMFQQHHHNMSISSTAAAAAPAAPARVQQIVYQRERSKSIYDHQQKMKTQVELRGMIEQYGANRHIQATAAPIQDSSTGPSSGGNQQNDQEEFDTFVANAEANFSEDDHLFDWLTPEIFPPDRNQDGN